MAGSDTHRDATSAIVRAFDAAGAFLGISGDRNMVMSLGTKRILKPRVGPLMSFGLRTEIFEPLTLEERSSTLQATELR